RGRLAELETLASTARTEGEQRVTDAAAEAEARLAGVEQRAAGLAAERDALAAELEAARPRHEDAPRRAASGPEPLAQGHTRASTAEQSLAESQRRSDALEAELATMRAAAGTRSEQAEAIAHERARWEADLDAARTRENTLAQRVRELERELERIGSEGSL